MILATLVAAIACGKKGPPLAPFVRVPAAVTNAIGQRIGNDIYLSFPVPSANVDGQQPADISELEVYAVTSARPPATEEQREVAQLVATIPVRPILPEPVSVNGSAAPPVPLPPGVDRGAQAVVRESLTAETLVPVELPIDDRARGHVGVAQREDVPSGDILRPVSSRCTATTGQSRRREAGERHHDRDRSTPRESGAGRHARSPMKAAPISSRINRRGMACGEA